MERCQYLPLNTDLDEIRLIELMPWSFQEDLRMRICNVPLLPPLVERSDNRIQLQHLQQTLPDDWIVRTTLDDRYMFCPGTYYAVFLRCIVAFSFTAICYL